MTREKPFWFYLFIALGLFVTLNIFIGANGWGYSQLPLVLYFSILAVIIFKYHVFRLRSIPVFTFSLLIVYGALGSLYARLSGQQWSYFTAMGLGVIVISLHFLPARLRIDTRLIKRFLYLGSLLFLISRLVWSYVSTENDFELPVFFLTHEVSFLMIFAVLIPSLDKNRGLGLLGFILVTAFLLHDFRTTTFLTYVLLLTAWVLFESKRIKVLVNKHKLGLVFCFFVLGAVGYVFFEQIVDLVKVTDLYLRDIFNRVNTQTFRSDLNAIALEKILDKPLFGEVFQGQSISLEHFYYGVWRVDPVHNVFLTLGIQGGLIFLAIFLTLLGHQLAMSTSCAVRNWRTRPEAARLLATLVVALLGAMLSGMVNPFLGYSMGAFWFWTIIMLLYLVRGQLAYRGRDRKTIGDFSK